MRQRPSINRLKHRMLNDLYTLFLFIIIDIKMP